MPKTGLYFWAILCMSVWCVVHVLEQFGRCRVTSFVKPVLRDAWTAFQIF